ncbi:uncharacterized protein LOC129229547 [Uloborus diversus]|uniref:uncharacterized protein LOC129229547 n=1 Tax=Uloborus diversus TaxID=327109 RepID=UPI00240A8871|nr:uncharacterized protein LOC129229547 [Uloborus diversus]
MPPQNMRERWECSYLSKETDADFRQLYLKEVPRPKKSQQSKDPWTRLYVTPTYSALKRCNAPSRPPEDSLDLWLKSTCNQFKDWPINKLDAVRQPDLEPKRRCFCDPVPQVIERPFNHPLRIAPFCETPMNINYVKLAIECPHISQTNSGYSRKVENGNFYKL